MRRSIGFVLVMLGAATHAQAQESGRFGITMGYPASIGFIWHLSDRVAIRPEISFSQNTADSTSTIVFTSNGTRVTTVSSTAANDQWTVGVGASALLYVGRWESLRTYVSPRFVYTRNSATSTETTSATVTSIQPASEFISQSYFVSGAFGAQYALGRRFGVFGEVGLGFSHNTTDSTQNGAGTSRGHTIGSRTGAGVILYF